MGMSFFESLELLPKDAVLENVRNAFIADKSPSKLVNRVWIPEQTWANHYQIWSCLPVPQSTYSYYWAPTHGIAFEKLLDSFEMADEGDAVILHASCQNPTGVDPTREQWIQLCDLMIRKHLTPLFDAA